MKDTATYKLNVTSDFSGDKLLKGSWIVLVNAERIPPHVGMVFDGKYSSLNVSGRELDVNVLALVKTIQQQKIKAVFIGLKKHPVFSIDYLHGHFKIQIEQYQKVDLQTATCFTPVRTFFCENYALHAHTLEYLFHLFPELTTHDVISDVFTCNMESASFVTLNSYSAADIEETLNSYSRLRS